MSPQEAELIRARRQRFLVYLAITIGLYLLGSYRFGFNSVQLLSAFEGTGKIISQLLQPRWEDLPGMMRLTLQSLQIAAVGFFFGVVPVLLMIKLQLRSTRAPGWLRSVATALVSALDGIPAVVLAAIFVVATPNKTMGVIVAIALSSFAALSRHPHPGVMHLPGVFTQCVDTTMVIGLVGAGGASAQLAPALATADYAGASVIVIAIVLIVAAVRIYARLLETSLASPSFNYGFILLPAAILAWGMQGLIGELTGFGELLAVFAMVPPSTAAGSVVSREVTSSIFMAIMATIGAGVIAIPFSLVTARRTSPSKATSAILQAFVSLWSAIPELVLAVVLIRILGAGVIAGIAAMTIRSLALLTGENARSINSVDPYPAQAMAASGARGTAVVSQIILPQARPQLMCNALKNLRHNIRIAAGLGLVGAGGIGHFLSPNLDFQVWPNVGMALIWIVTAVVATDYVTLWIEKRI